MSVHGREIHAEKGPDEEDLQENNRLDFKIIRSACVNNDPIKF